MSLPTLLKAHAAAYAFGALMLATVQFSMNRIDWCAKTAIDRLAGQPHAAGGAFPALAALALLACVAFAARVASRWFLFNAGRHTEYTLRKRLLEHLQTLGPGFFHSLSVGELLSRITQDVTQLRLLCGFAVMNLINAVFAATSSLQVMLSLSVRLTLVCLMHMPLLLLVTRMLGKRVAARTQENQAALGQLSACVQSELSALRLVRSFALEEAQQQRFDAANKAYCDSSVRLAATRNLTSPLMGVANAVSLLLFFGYGGVLLVRGPEQGGVSPGGFFAFWLALGRLMWPFLAVGFAWSIVQRSRVSLVRIQEILETEPEVRGGELPQMASLLHTLRVTTLSFAYGERQVLRSVSFSIEAGGSLAVVGRTGSGKSTLGRLLARLLPTPTGCVYLGGVDLCTLPLEAVRRRIGYAEQEPFLFSSTVAENLGLALDEIDTPAAQERLRHAASEAQILPEILALPEGFATRIGERGIQLSGGQRQRLALARARVAGTPFLILDDPLSAVDAQTEEAVLAPFFDDSSPPTRVLITSRMAVASRCDRVLVLDEGQVLEQGTPEELLHRGGAYAQLVEEQRLAYASAPSPERTEP